jgi:endo-1,4-beta-xylanase
MTPISRRDCLTLALAGTTTACAPWHALIGDAPSAAGTAPGSLNALANTKGLRFGTAVGTGPSGAPHPAGFDGRRANSFDDARVREITVRECGILVPENELKWYTLRPTPDGFDFRRADRLAAFATDNAMAMRGHTLLWHHPQWFPTWVAGHDFGARPSAAAEDMLRNHVDTVCSRYGTRIFSWDVVNETVDPATGAMRETVFTKYLGPHVIDIVYHAAREAAPHAQLVYNDYMSWGPGNETHRTGVLRLLERLRARNVPVDALGVQSHIGTGNSDDSVGFSTVDETAWRKFLDEAVSMGLDLVITEFDVHDKGLAADTLTRDHEVAAFGRSYLDLMLSYKQLSYVMCWGLVDHYSWLQDRWRRTDGLAKRPCPYDDKYKPKPLREAIADAFRAAPARV